MDFWKGMVSSMLNCKKTDLNTFVGGSSSSDLCSIPSLWGVRLRSSFPQSLRQE